MRKSILVAAGVMLVLALFIFWPWSQDAPQEIDTSAAADPDLMAPFVPGEPPTGSEVTIVRLDVEATDSLAVVLRAEFVAQADAGVEFDDRRLVIAAPIRSAVQAGQSLSGVTVQEGLDGLEDARVMVWVSLHYRGHGRYGERDFFWLGRSLDGFQPPLGAPSAVGPEPDAVFEVVPWPRLELDLDDAGALKVNGRPLAGGETAPPLTLEVTRDVTHEQWKPVPKEADVSATFPETEIVTWEDATFATTVQVTNLGVRTLEDGD